MLWGAFTGVFVSAWTGNVWLAVLAGCVVGILVALLLGCCAPAIWFRSDVGGSGDKLVFVRRNCILNVLIDRRKRKYFNPGEFICPKRDYSHSFMIFPFSGQIVSGHPVFTYLAFFLTWVVYILMYRTRLGVHMRAVGENPQAATTMGINVNIEFNISLWRSVDLCLHLGGMSLSMAYLQMFQREMAAGRGYIGIAAVRLGGGHPVGTMLSAMLFGVADALANQLGSLNIPSQFVQSIPYATTVIGLAVFAIQKQTG